MEKKDLLHHCRYYKGEKEPQGDNQLFRGLEAKWVELMVDGSENEGGHSDNILNEYLEDYIGVGLTFFEEFDDTPVTLKALLFARFCYWNSGSILDCVEPFKDFYLNEYKKKDAAK